MEYCLFGEFFCVMFIVEGGNIYAFGDGSSGQLGLGVSRLESSSPCLLKLPFKVSLVSCGENFTALVSGTRFSGFKSVKWPCESESVCLFEMSALLCMCISVYDSREVGKRPDSLYIIQNVYLS